VLDGSADGLAGGGVVVVPVTLARAWSSTTSSWVEPGRIAAAEPAACTGCTSR